MTSRDYNEGAAYAWRKRFDERAERNRMNPEPDRFGTFTVTREDGAYVLTRPSLTGAARVAFLICDYTQALDLENAAMHIRQAIGAEALRTRRSCPKCGHDRTSNASVCHYCHGAATGPESDLARCKRLNPDGCPGCPCCPETREGPAAAPDLTEARDQELSAKVTHHDYATAHKPPRPCTAHDQNYGGECFNCGYPGGTA